MRWTFRFFTLLFCFGLKLNALAGKGVFMSARKVLFLAPAQAVTRIFAALKDLDVEVGIAENMRGASAFIRQSSPALIITRPSLPGYKAEDLLAVGVDDPAFPPVIIAAERGTVLKEGTQRKPPVLGDGLCPDVCTHCPSVPIRVQNHCEAHAGSDLCVSCDT